MEVLSKEKIFITGITGFTGKYLEKDLIELGYEVYGTTFDKLVSENHYKCNILKEEEIYKRLSKIRPDYVIHLAAISFVATKDQKSFYDVNVFGTLNLLNVIERLNFQPKKILIASSAAVYGNMEGELDESMCPRPVNHYGNSKLVMENMVRQYFDRLNIVIVRPFNYTGVGQDTNFLIPKIVSHFKERKLYIELGNLDTYREYNDVRDISAIYINILKSMFKSDVINVSSANSHSINEILSLMEQISHHSIEVRINPDFVRKNEIKELKGSVNKLNTVLNDMSKFINLESTLKEMYFN